MATSKDRRATARFAALAMVLVLLGSLSITACTSDWIGSVPYHDHILLGARALGLVHHAHQGDELSHWMNGVKMVGAAMPGDASDSVAPEQSASDGVVSLKSLNGLQPEINSYAATGMFALVAFLAFAARGVILRPKAGSLASGQLPAPLYPPPRPA